MALIGLISDVHATVEPVKEALSIFAKAGVEQVLCAGDVAGYMDELEPTIELLIKHGCKTVVGNHDLKYLARHQGEPDSPVTSFLKQLPATYETNIEGKSIYMVHAQPPDENHGGIKLLDKNGIVQAEQVDLWSKTLCSFKYDVLVVGHTHQVFMEKMNNTLVVNPGSSIFNHCCAILHLPEMTVEMIPLSGKKIEKTWNWGEHMIYKK